jgi:hypothetical protein
MLYGSGIFQLLAKARFRHGAFVVVAYHGISKTMSPLCTSIDTFEKHIRMFLKWGKVSNGEELVRWLRDGEYQVHGLHFMITFDDAYQNVFQNAIPIMEEHGIRGTVFVAPPERLQWLTLVFIRCNYRERATKGTVRLG